MARRSSAARRVLILDVANGGAHHGAAVAVRRYLTSQHATSVDVECCDFLERCLPKAAVLARFAYQQVNEFFPEGSGTLDDMFSRCGELPTVSELRDVGVALAAELFERLRPDVVVSTHPFPAAVAAELGRRRGVPTVLVHTDFGLHGSWMHPDTSLFFVPCKETREDLVVAGASWDRVSVSGVPCRERFEGFSSRAESRHELGLSDRFTAVVVPVAGAADETRRVAMGLAAAGIQTIVPLDREDRSRRRLETDARGNDALLLHDAAVGIERLMRASDLMVCGGGGAIARSGLRMGLPCIIYTPVPGQEIHNIDFLVNAGAALATRDAADVREKVRYLAEHPGRLSQLTDAAFSLGRPGATQTVCERVLALL